jgi:hypothetical protein
MEEAGIITDQPDTIHECYRLPYNGASVEAMEDFLFRLYDAITDDIINGDEGSKMVLSEPHRRVLGIVNDFFAEDED